MVSRPENHVAIREAIQPGGLLTRAVLDSWDVHKRGALSVAELEAGINALCAHEAPEPWAFALSLDIPLFQGNS